MPPEPPQTPPPDDAQAHLAVQPDAQGGGRKHSPKGTKATVRSRVDEVLRLILAGAEFWDIVQYATENAWPVGERQIRTYMARAYDLMAREAEKDRERLISRAIATRRSLLARAMATADYRTALAIAKDEAQLLDLYPRRQAAPSSLTDEELEAEIRDLVHRARPEPGERKPAPSVDRGAAAPSEGQADKSDADRP